MTDDNDTTTTRRHDMTDTHPTLAELDRTHFVASPAQLEHLLEAHWLTEATLELLKEGLEA